MRIFVTQLFIIFGAFAVVAMTSPVLAMVMFVALKIGFDVYFHRREHAG